MAVERQHTIQLDLETVEARTILRSLVGSTVHGLGVAGTDDRDEVGVCIEPADYVIGLRVDENQAMTTAGELEHELKQAIDSSPLPDQPDYQVVNDFLITAYTQGWRTFQ